MALGSDMNNKEESPKSHRQATVEEIRTPNIKDYVDNHLKPTECSGMTDSELEHEEEVEGLDSDEERLEAYRKLKQELDEEEKSSIDDEVHQQEKPTFSLPKLTSFQHCISDVGQSISHSRNIQDSEKNTELQYFCENVSGKNDVENYSCEVECINSNEQANTLCGTEEDDVIGNASADDNHEETFSSGVDTVSKDRQSSILAIEKLPTTKEVVFVHNEDMDEEDVSPRIDWSVITLPVRQADTLDDRLQLFSAGRNIGFQSEVAAEAQAASRRFWIATNNAEETFGGLGEGEQVFGSDDDGNNDEEN